MSTLSITNRTLTLGSTVFQISNITSVGKYRLKPKYIISLSLILICSILSLLGIQWIINNPEGMMPKLFIVTTIGLAGYGIFERFSKTNKFGLSIEMSSGGGTRLIASENENLVDSIIARIIEAMNSRNSQLNYTFNIADGDIINQRGLFETGVKIS